MDNEAKKFLNKMIYTLNLSSKSAMAVEARIDREFFSFPEFCAKVWESPLILTPFLPMLDCEKSNRFWLLYPLPWPPVTRPWSWSTHNTDRVTKCSPSLSKHSLTTLPHFPSSTVVTKLVLLPDSVFWLWNWRWFKKIILNGIWSHRK